ncbi:unnamed protein product [Symbiodinium natans]|uniref:Uncharacterized protein n=1 Tax=Symbiodinium natans TaxID=878477 RepID=A0A812KZL6_9DINO|nr:unnamed protein product [Symbiodinium natans]
MLVVRLAAAVAHQASCMRSQSWSMMQPDCRSPFLPVWLLRPSSKIHSVWTHVRKPLTSDHIQNQAFLVVSSCKLPKSSGSANAWECFERGGARSKNPTSR